MDIQVSQKTYQQILPLREIFLKENNIQIRYDSCHYRGWADSYLIAVDDIEIGYGSIKGKDNLTKRDTVFEFFILEEFRNKAGIYFAELIATTNTKWIECQSNESLLSSMIFELCSDIYSDVILFEDDIVTTHIIEGVEFIKWDGQRDVFGLNKCDIGSYVLEWNGKIVATGDALTHYNYPFVDIFMEVDKNHAGKGFGSYFVQEMKKECYKAGRTPAARCNISNPASKATLLKAGFKICGYMLTGTIKY